MIRELLMPKVRATLQMATVQIPFKIICEEPDKGSNPLIPDIRRFLNGRWWFWQKIRVSWKARGKIKFFDKTHGYLDHGDFVNVELSARLVWSRHFKRVLELTGTLPNIGRFCFTGWGICTMEVYDAQNNTLLQLQGRVETEIVS
jgi:hypothetical protein